MAVEADVASAKAYSILVDQATTPDERGLWLAEVRVSLARALCSVSEAQADCHPTQ